MERQKAIQVAGSLKKTSLLLESSLQGWLYAGFVDHAFLSESGSELSAKPSLPIAAQPSLLSETPERIATLAAQTDLVSQFQRLKDLAAHPSITVLGDSFYDSDLSYESLFATAPLRVVIIGAGPVGLTLANALKVHYQQAIAVLVIDNRCQAPGIKYPYSRHWVTNILQGTLNGVVDPHLSQIFSNLGDKTYIGLPINLYETLLMLSCKEQGVAFRYTTTFDFVELQDLAIDLVFDASGGRYQSTPYPEAVQSPAIPGKMHALPTHYGKGYSAFGVNPHTLSPKLNLKIVDTNQQKLPLINNQLIHLRMMKLSELPMSSFEILMAYIKENNTDNKFYLWPGRLKPPINQALLLINLTEVEAAAMSALLRDRQPLAELDQLPPKLDPRFQTIIDTLHAIPGIVIEPPFNYRPYFRDRYAVIEPDLDLPLIPIGDSIYNGHPKVGNGLGAHLAHIRRLRDKLTKLISLP